MPSKEHESARGAPWERRVGWMEASLLLHWEMDIAWRRPLLRRLDLWEPVGCEAEVGNPSRWQMAVVCDAIFLSSKVFHLKLPKVKRSQHPANAASSDRQTENEVRERAQLPIQRNCNALHVSFSDTVRPQVTVSTSVNIWEWCLLI